MHRWMVNSFETQNPGDSLKKHLPEGEHWSMAAPSPGQPLEKWQEIKPDGGGCSISQSACHAKKRSHVQQR